jgi:hypothetical protein
MRTMLWVALATLISPVVLAHVINVDGSPSDWIGTPASVSHETTYSGNEWIYTGDGEDTNPSPAGDVESNGDITEVRLTADATNLYVLVRVRDVTHINEPCVAIGIENDDNPSDANGLIFLGDESGVGYPGAQQHPEHSIAIHNAQDGITWVELFHDAGSGFWYTPAGTDSYIDPTNEVIEAQIPLADIGLTTSSVFRITLITLDNDDIISGGVGFNNDKDTTVDYIPNDAVDVMAGTPGAYGNWSDRDMVDNVVDSSYPIDVSIIFDTTVPAELSVLRED